MSGGAGQQDDRVHLRSLIVLALLLTCVYAVIAVLSWRFDFDGPPRQRPIVTVLVLFGAAFAAYLFAIRLAARARQDWRLLTLIVYTAVLFRAVLLFSLPIQEVDIYRYLWDGAVSNSGVSPFRYSPEQVRTATNTTTDEDLRQLAESRNQQPALADILRRVHFGELPTIYPPVSQAVFAAATWMTPPQATVWLRVLILKACFVAFDLATLVLVVQLLRLCRKPVGLSLIYAWCPLLLKEVANSGHLDAVAVFLTTLAVYLAVRLRRDPRQTSIIMTARASGIAVVLALAIGAKLYPIILVPLLIFYLVSCLGWTRTLVPLTTLAATTLLVVWPMLPEPAAALSPPTIAPPNAPLPSVGGQPTSPTAAPKNDPSLGVKTFLRRWEMNDFLFLLLVENLKPTEHLSAGPEAWFSVAPQPLRSRIIQSAAFAFAIEREAAPFLVARATTGLVFLALALGFAYQASRTTENADVCEAVFLTLAWFWLLCPTQNPWYWTWALPFLPFARSRVWLAISGLVFVYYLRFWFSYHWPSTPVLGTDYVGSAFFDFVMTWVEFAPWFACLFIAHWRRRSEPVERHTASKGVRMGAN